MTNQEKKEKLKKDIKSIVKKTREVLGKDNSLPTNNEGLNLEHFIRFTPVAKTCQTVRKNRGIRSHRAANTLNVPQHTIKDIEETRISEISLSVLKIYVDYLGLTESFEIWEKDNADVIKNFKK